MANVIVVDDERMYQKELRWALTEQGHAVATAGDSRAAMKVIDGFKPSLLIVDWMLRNHVTGLELARSLRRRHSDLKIIITSGYPEAELEFEVGADGVEAFLQKPFSVEELLPLVDKALGKEPDA